MNIEITLATAKDLDTCQNINVVMNSAHAHPDWFLRECIAQKRIFVAIVNKQIVGYLLYQILWGNLPFLSLLKVLPEFQRKGIGENLVAALEEKLRKQGYKKFVSSTEQRNQVGQAFHEKNGFIPSGALEAEKDNDELFYTKFL